MKIFSADQIRKWDEYTITHEPVSSIDLMERAASACTNWLINSFDDSHSFKIFCGKGNNGGDGLAIARLLSQSGYHAEVYILEFGTLGSPDFQVNLHKLHEYQVPIHFLQHADFFPEISNTDVVVDAIFGTGINRGVEGLSAQLIHHINIANAQVISIDMPSGLFADKSAMNTGVVQANYTLTFQCIKLSLLFPEHELFSGEIIVLDIGLPDEYATTTATHYYLVDHHQIKSIYKKRKKFAHKGSFGHALLIAGEKGKMGAAVLCTKACLRAGAGLVTTMIPPDQFSIVQTAVPEAMVIANEHIDIAEHLGFYTIGIGPGMGMGIDAIRIVQEIILQYNKPLVLDADALNILAGNHHYLKEIPPGSILTPHVKEFERLFGKSNSHLRKIQIARQQAKKMFVYILLKGHYSMLACPDGEVYFNITGNAGMATAGSGDVLTGIITGLLAQGYPSKEAALFGMYIHGLAGDLAANTLSQEAMLAGDIVQFLGNAFMKVSSA